MKFNITNILSFYDIPQLFTAQDIVGTFYIFLNVSAEDEYLFFPVSAERLHKVVSWKISLREIIVENEVNYWYISKIDDFENISFSNLESIKINELIDSWLPEEEFTLREDIIDAQDQYLVSLGQSRQKTIIDIALSDANDNMAIGIESLGLFLKSFQWLVRNLFRKKLKGADSYERDIVQDSEYWVLNAIAVNPGSFRLSMEVETPIQIWETTIEVVLNQMNAFFDSELDIDRLKYELRENPGHSITSLKKFVEILKSNNIQFEFAWYSLTSGNLSRQYVWKNHINTLLETLSQVEELTNVQRELVWVLKSADLDTEIRILENESKKSSTINLNWNHIEWIRMGRLHKVICEEIISENSITGKEKITLNMISWEECDS